MIKRIDEITLTNKLGEMQEHLLWPEGVNLRGFSTVWQAL